MEQTSSISYVQNVDTINIIRILDSKNKIVLFGFVELVDNNILGFFILIYNRFLYKQLQIKYNRLIKQFF